MVPDQSTVSTAARTDDVRRIDPDEALRPGRSDARALLTVWYIRKSAYWLVFTGTAMAYALRRTDELTIDWSDTESVARELWSPLAPLVLAVVVRLGTSWVALGLAAPLVRDYESPLEARGGRVSAITKWFDRRQLAKAYRALRWTHHVRQRALTRLGARRGLVAKLDPIIDWVNVLSFVAMVVIVVASPT